MQIDTHIIDTIETESNDKNDVERLKKDFAEASNRSYNDLKSAHSTLQKYAAPEVTDSSKRRASTPYSRDMWGVGCVLWEAFNGILPAAR